MTGIGRIIDTQTDRFKEDKTRIDWVREENNREERETGLEG